MRVKSLKRILSWFLAFETLVAQTGVGKKLFTMLSLTKNGLSWVGLARQLFLTPVIAGAIPRWSGMVDRFSIDYRDPFKRALIKVLMALQCMIIRVMTGPKLSSRSRNGLLRVTMWFAMHAGPTVTWPAFALLLTCLGFGLLFILILSRSHQKRPGPKERWSLGSVAMGQQHRLGR